jgi:hypothetical protein
MEDSMAVDVVLWFILAAMAVWVTCGCVCTARPQKSAAPSDGALDQTFDRAA